MKVLSIILVLYLFMNFLSSCAPVFSDMQSAKTVGKGNFEITGANTSIGDDVNSGGVQSELNAQFAYGLDDRLEIRAKYIQIFNDHVARGYGIGFGAKYSIIKDKLSAYLPVGFGDHNNVTPKDTWQTQPTLIYTSQIINNLELTNSFKGIFMFNDFSSSLFATNIGVGWRVFDDMFTIRYEVGMAFELEDTTKDYFQASFGLSFYP